MGSKHYRQLRNTQKASRARAARRPASPRPIWEVIEKIGASVPKEEWAKVPTDASKNLDHYLYGHPKLER